MNRPEGATALPLDRRGFTLLEVLLAVALFAIVLAAVYGTFFLSQKAMDGVDDSLLKLKECRMILDVMSREVDSLSYTPAVSDSGLKVEDRDNYGKEISRITFTAFSPLQPGLSVISYYAEEKDGKTTLYKKMRSIVRPESDKDRQEEGVEMIEDIDSFAVEAATGDKWVKTWNTGAAQGLPKAIRITVKVMMKGRPVTFVETVTPKIGQPL